MKAARALTVGGVLGFLLLTGVSALRYPGGTQADRSSEGYAFFGNYWCDLYRSQALNGEDHAVGAQLAQVGALAVVLAIFAGLWCATACGDAAPSSRAAAQCSRVGAEGGADASGVSATTTSHSRINSVTTFWMAGTPTP